MVELIGAALGVLLIATLGALAYERYGWANA